MKIVDLNDKRKKTGDDMTIYEKVAIALSALIEDSDKGHFVIITDTGDGTFGVVSDAGIENSLYMMEVAKMQLIMNGYEDGETMH